MNLNKKFPNLILFIKKEIPPPRVELGIFRVLLVPQIPSGMAYHASFLSNYWNVHASYKLQPDALTTELWRVFCIPLISQWFTFRF